MPVYKFDLCCLNRLKEKKEEKSLLLSLSGLGVFVCFGFLFQIYFLKTFTALKNGITVETLKRFIQHKN